VLCSANDHEYILFRDYIAGICGIVIKPEKAYLIETRLTMLMLEAGAENFREFYEYIIAGSDPQMPQKIINAITVNETMWFRDAALWKYLEEEKLPALAGELVSGNKTKIRIWSAAVSTGQEIYSAVMCVDNFLKKNNPKGVSLSNFEFFATDISERVLGIAKKGRYDKVSISRGLDEHHKNLYFNSNESAWYIDQSIRDRVNFGQFNLMDDFSPFGIFDIIFCRYVLIYFSDELKTKIAIKMHDSLADNGVFITGNYVLYDMYSAHFHVKHYDNLTYYTKKLVSK